MKIHGQNHNITWFTIYIQVKHEEMKELTEAQQVLKSYSNMNQEQQMPSDSAESSKRSKKNEQGEKVFLLFLLKISFRKIKIFARSKMLSTL